MICRFHLACLFAKFNQELAKNVEDVEDVQPRQI